MACSATARSFAPCALARRMPAADSAGLSNWSVPALTDWMKRRRGMLASNSLRQRPETTRTSASGARAFSSSSVRTSKLFAARPRLRNSACN